MAPAGSSFEITGISASNDYLGEIVPSHALGLLPASYYLLVVRARNAQGLGWASPVVPSQTAAPPPPPPFTLHLSPLPSPTHPPPPSPSPSP